MQRIHTVVAIVLVFALFLIPVPAIAGTNGQQLGVYVCGAEYVDIEGNDQFGDWSTYRLWADPNDCINRIIYNWWWEGVVTLTAHGPAGIVHSMRTYVPEDQGDNDVFWTELLPFGMSDVYQERAEVWVDADIPYDQYDYQNGYRTDCSGYLSFIWQLPVSANTVSLGQYAYEVNGWWNLAIGDAINDQEWGNDGHVVMFAGWEDFDSLRFWAYEENPGEGGAARTVRQLIETDEGYSIPELNMYGVVFQRRD